MRSKLLTLLSRVFLVLPLVSSHAYAEADCTYNASGQECSYIPIGSTLAITPNLGQGFGCEQVTNNCTNSNNDDLMVPYKTSDEWTKFLGANIVTGANDTPICVTITNCASLQVTIQKPNPDVVAPGGNTNLRWTVTGNNGNVTCTPQSSDGSWPSPQLPYYYNQNLTVNVTPNLSSGTVSYQLTNCVDGSGNPGISSNTVNLNVSNVTCSAGNALWMNNCSGPTTAVSYDPKNKQNDNVENIINTATGYSGSETATCQADGTWQYSNPSCNVGDTQCPALPGGKDTVMICAGSCQEATFKSPGCPIGNIGDTCTVRSINCADKIIPCADPPSYMCNVCEFNSSTLTCADVSGSAMWTGTAP